MVDILTDPTFLLVIISLGFPFLMLLVLVAMDMIDSKKAKILYFDSENLCKMIGKKVKDGVVEIKKKQIHVDRVRPLNYLSGFLVKSYRPLYIIKHDKALPCKFTEKGIEVISATNLKNLVENKTLDALLQPKQNNSMLFMVLVMGLICGAAVGYLFSTLG